MKIFKSFFIVLVCAVAVSCTATAYGCSGNKVPLHIDNASKEEVVLHYLEYYGLSETNTPGSLTSAFENVDELTLTLVTGTGHIGHARFWGHEWASFWGGGINYWRNNDDSLVDSVPESIRTRGGTGVGENQFLIADVPSQGRGRIKNLNDAKYINIPKESIMTTSIQRGAHLLEIKTADGDLVERVCLIIYEETPVDICYYNIGAVNSYRIVTATYK